MDLYGTDLWVQHRSSLFKATAGAAVYTIYVLLFAFMRELLSVSIYTACVETDPNLIKYHH